MAELNDSSRARMFMNPLLDTGADPWIYKHDDGFYYFTITTYNRIVLWKCTNIIGIDAAPHKTVWTPPAEGPYSHNVWAPEIHRIRDKWYIYFTANDGGGDETRRIFVLENPSPDPMEGDWDFKGAVNTQFPGLDGTVLQHNGQLYFAYAGYGFFPDYGTGIYISEMENPWTLTGSNVLLSAPTEGWEKQGGMTINEGPVFLKRAGKLFLIFSASATWSDDYCLGMLTVTDTSRLLEPNAWTKHPGPVFSKNEPNGVFSPGHNSFTQSPDGTEDWIVYHACFYPEAERKTRSGDQRNPRAQKIVWNPDGTPDFGTPSPANVLLAVPSGLV